MEILFKHLYVIRKGIYGLDYLMVGYVTNFCVDVIYQLVDPRISVQE